MFKIFTFVKNEQHIINDWLLYHSSIVGANNLFVVDNGSTDSTDYILREWVDKGLNYAQYKSSFANKHKVITHAIKNVAKNCFAVPLDCDEFLTLKTDSGVCVESNSIINAVCTQPTSDGFRYKLQQFDVVPITDREHDAQLTQLHTFNRKCDDVWLKQFAKTFYHGKWFISTDQGNHHGWVKGSNTSLQTDLTLLHYNVRSYKHFVEKTIKGAQAYNHHKHVNPQHTLGTHYHRRYWAIQNGRGVEQMNKEFAGANHVVIKSLADKLKKLHEDSNNNQNEQQT